MKTRRKQILMIVLCIVALCSINSLFLQKKNITIQDTDLPDSFEGYKIAHLSDLHNSYFARTLTMIQKEQPDLIVLTGDLMDSRTAEYDNSLKLIEQLKDVAPILFVTGNHEGWDRTQAEQMEKQLNALGVESLHNTCTGLMRNTDSITVCGLDAPDWTNKEQAAYDRAQVVRSALQTMSDTDGFTILLAHHPEFFELYAEHGFDLILSGHTHGGQIRIPFLGAPFAPDQGFFPKYACGVYRLQDSMMEVSPGIGNSLLPIRLNDPPQIVFLTLKKGTES